MDFNDMLDKDICGFALFTDQEQLAKQTKS